MPLMYKKKQAFSEAQAVYASCHKLQNKQVKSVNSFQNMNLNTWVWSVTFIWYVGKILT